MLASVTDRLLDDLVHFLLPAWCLSCHDRLPRRVSPLGLCVRCRERLRPPAARRCPLCGGVTSDHRDAWLCAACSYHHPPPFDRLVGAWSYEPPIDAVVRGLKYRRLDYLADELAAGMVPALRGVLDRIRPRPSARGSACIVPVPLHWRRRWNRGYDQALLLSRALARRVDLPCLRLLSRCRHTTSQTGRSAPERRRNVAGAFVPRRRTLSVQARSAVVLVDDVATTGATLSAAAEALRDSGASRIVAVVAALTPKPSAPGSAGDRGRRRSI